MITRLARTLPLFLGLALGAAGAPAPDPAAHLAEVQRLRSQLKPQTGTVTLPGGLATIALAPEFRYLSPADAVTVLSGIWGNPRGESTLGMIVPAGFDPLRRGTWAVDITFTADGYVKDDDAGSIDYNTLLTQMKAATAAASTERQKQGYPSIELVGWAEPPRYDAASHKMYWAKAIRFGNDPGQTLNYSIRILGRRGVLELNAIAHMQDLPQVKAATPAILKMVNFQEGNRYVDFNPSTDKLATYGLAALVVGGLAAKAGLFKVILVGLLAAKKFVLIAIAAIAAYLRKMKGRFSKKSDGLARPSGGPS